MIGITIGRFGERARNVKVPVGSSIKDLLKAAGIKKAGSEKIWIDGARTKQDQKVEKGDVINIVGSRGGGNA